MSLSTLSLVQSVYDSLYHVIERVIDKDAIINCDYSALELVYKNDLLSLYHVGHLVPIKNMDNLSFDFCVVQITEGDLKTQITLSFSLVKYFNATVVYRPRFLTSVMRSLGNYGLLALEKEIKNVISSMEIENNYIMTRSNVNAFFSIISLPEGTKNTLTFLDNKDDNCLQVNISMSLINEKDYEVGGRIYMKRKEHFDSIKK